MSRLLLVEDDAVLVDTLTISLRARGFDVEAAPDGRTALDAVARRPPDVVVLDLGLPDLDGVEVVRQVRTGSDVPVLILSARDAEAAKVAALDAGADDYVTKPFGMDELLARVRAALRRAAPHAPGAVVRAGALSIDLTARRVERDGALVRLTPTEWNLLEVLVQSSGALVSQRDLLRDVWGLEHAPAHYLRVYVAQLRRKLEADPSSPRHLLTAPGVGYRFEP
ncbi:response regulator [uncultured Cellulomonas sp.]|uniref:response regulator n=1 Tax=uncultured Cellulomonas sp. TaxID=189682 RepID=UPI00260D9EE3|nr:response regulator transcription factor [uncultured Cellulomonas sp.]